jgi:nucleoside-diphosphate kinase
MVKPDGVERKLVGEVVSRFERKGFNLVALEYKWATRELAEKHYSVHVGKPFFEELVSFIISGPVVAMVWEGSEAIALSRKMIGSLRPTETAPGTIRGDFATTANRNIIHGSDSPESAAYEIALWFPSL